jgi:SAM-dependent methyltransferase
VKQLESDTVPRDLSSPAITETIELLHEADRSRLQIVGGYLDLVGASVDDPLGPKLGQRVFRSRLVPLVYERFVRPRVSRFLLGRGGPAEQEEEFELTVSMLDPMPGSRVLDVGCGPGNYTRRLAHVASDGLVVGLDASAAMLAAAVRRSADPRVSYVRADCVSLPFRSDAFDAVCSVAALYLIPDPMSALDEMIRVLAPGGGLAISASCAKGPGRGRQIIGVHDFGREELTGALEERGLVQIEQRVFKRMQIVAARKPEE